MTELIGIILGPEYIRPFISLAASFPIMLFCSLLFAHTMKRRRFFALRFLAGVLIIVGCYIGAAVLRTDYSSLATRIVTSYFAYFVILPLLFLCYNGTTANNLLCWCAGFATQEIASRGFTLLLFLAGVDSQQSMSFFGEFNALRDYSVFYLIHLFIALICYGIFRQSRGMDADRSSVRTITLLSVFSALWLVISNSIAQEFQRESAALYQIHQVSGFIFSAFVLLLRTGIFSQNQYRYEIALMEQLLHEERK